MEFDTTSNDVLDLLFDDGCGLLKNDVSYINAAVGKHSFIEPYFLDQNNIHNHSISFNDLDLSDNLFENLISSAVPDSLLDDDPPDKRKPFHSDHDYVAHKSPSENSDSGISVISDDSGSPLRLSLSSEKGVPDDQLEYVTYLNCCVPSSQQHTEVTGLSLYGDSKTYDTLSTNDTSNANYDETRYSGLDDDISIDFDLDTLDATLLPSENVNRDMQSVVVFSGVDKRINKKDATLPYTMKDVDLNVASYANFPELRLSDEEKELLAREGVTLPTNLPLTRDEERVLKSVRRKIRNKISAKESRKRKQGYVEGLEQRVKLCTHENRELQKKVDSLEKQNVSLISQLKRLHSLVVKSGIPAQASTCAMVLLLSFALFVVPTFNPFGSGENHTPDNSGSSVRGKARSLLEIENVGMADNDDDPYGVSPRPVAPWEKPLVAQSSPVKLEEVVAHKSIVHPEKVPTENVPFKTHDLNIGSPGLSRDLKIELDSRIKDNPVNSNDSYVGNPVADQNFIDSNSENLVDT